MNQKNLKNSQQIGDYDLSGFLAELNSINHLAILIAQLGQAAYYLAREEHTSEADTVSVFLEVVLEAVEQDNKKAA